MPPSIVSRRARKTCSKRGATTLTTMKNRTANAIRPMMISPRGGTSGFSSAERTFMLTVSLSAQPSPGRGSGAEDEGDDEADQRQRLGQGEPEERVGAGQAGRLGLTRGGLDVRRPHDAHTDTGADGGEAVADRADGAGELCEKVHDGVFPPVSSPGVLRAAGGGGGAVGWCWLSARLRSTRSGTCPSGR